MQYGHRVIARALLAGLSVLTFAGCNSVLAPSNLLAPRGPDPTAARAAAMDSTVLALTALELDRIQLHVQPTPSASALRVNEASIRSTRSRLVSMGVPEENVDNSLLGRLQGEHQRATAELTRLRAQRGASHPDVQRQARVLQLIEKRRDELMH
jgi:hypothetical protein